ncbi:cell division protein FtsL [Oikeobacillus pervagus]|uniref:Cell division protein FtsL n=1 Tax=Oikeobacillus pervagus TaxID=1325931 RepID=A0AAJ1WJ17_9BACI|nr:cell division protein FtsL [Oikeobacillus pervagus]MDQ0215235.1 cell division protein FtsL [Oikeobacillus pervagus]
MSNLARKYQIEEQHQQKNASQRQSKQKKKIRVTPGEKLLLLLFVVLISFIGVKIISTETAIYTANREIQDMERQIKVQKKVNKELKIQVSEESTYEKIWKKAKELGLDLNEQNVKVVQPK